MRLPTKYFIVAGVFILSAFMNSPLSHARTGGPPDSGEIAVNIYYGKDTALFTEYTTTVQLYLLTDDDDILAQIEQLKEQSKAKLEPLVKQYMQAAEKLTQLALEVGTDREKQDEKKRLHNIFTIAEKTLNAILKKYRGVIDSLIEHHTLQTFTMPLSRIMHHVSSINHQFENVAPGKYRVYGIMAFSTTTLRWFEHITVKGGDRHTIYLTQDNITNPYWTDLNWWSFMNLDFSKHH